MKYLRNLLKSKDGRTVLASSTLSGLGIVAIFVAAASSGKKIDLSASVETACLYGGIIVSEASSIFTIAYAYFREKYLLDIFKNPNPAITK